MEYDHYMMSAKRPRPSNSNSVFDKFRDFQAEASKLVLQAYWSYHILSHIEFYVGIKNNKKKP